MTNFEKIKQMSKDELASFLNDLSCKYCAFNGSDDCSGQCTVGVKIWLQKEVEE